MKAFIYMVGYDHYFQELTKSGWGCGYVAIPFAYKCVKQHFDNIKQQRDDNLYSLYFKGIYFEQEITYTDTIEIGDKKYFVIGFDTAHSFNSNKDDFNFVFKETNKILKAIEDFEGQQN